MKKIYLLLFTVFTLSAFAQNPVPNPSFETWSGSSLTGWTNSTNITQTTDAHTGTYAVKGEYTGGTAPQLSVGSGNGFNTGTRWAYLNFYYKFVKTGSATISVSAYFDNPNYTIGQASRTITAAAGSYTLVSIPVNFSLSGNPTDCTIDITLNNGASGSYFIIDDVSLTAAAPTAINEIQPQLNLSLLPNPASNNLTISFYNAQQANCLFNLYDIAGREVKQLELNNTNTIIDISEIPQGLYFATIRKNDLVETKRLVISR